MRIVHPRHAAGGTQSMLLWVPPAIFLVFFYAPGPAALAADAAVHAKWDPAGFALAAPLMRLTEGASLEPAMR
ncbi:hypothetical protein AUR04nite_18170 [Glutamicibacter uratoxydans]|uniref:Uncharacterized protein n=1 Tax=Glutamicibacter uratoxydans TaxID=43667 RepID=A0A4Y4DRQ5_GLUUR|nr:hypothetical protein AUR04nite_18170 [Glutamicibacter uratoxydans]